jgi:hypothetical protein
MKVYVATAFVEKLTAKYWMNRLREIGVTITHDWTTAEQPARGELELPIDEQRQHARADVQGVIDADVVWVLAPAQGGTGCWFEMGVAHGLARYRGMMRPDNRVSPTGVGPVIVSGPRRTIFTSLFMHFDTHKDAFDAIAAFQDAEANPPPRRHGVPSPL